MDNLRQAFEKFCQYDHKFKPRKSEFCRQKVEFLGGSVRLEGVEMGDQYMEAVRDWPRPVHTKAIEQFLGFANFPFSRSLSLTFQKLQPHCKP